jgi:hypothetical protein
MEIVAHSDLMNRFETIDVFVKSNKTETFNNSKIKLKIRDEFTIKYKSFTQREVTKFGMIGTIGFYVDNELDSGEIVIFNGERIIESEYTEDDILDVRNYLNNLLRDVNENNSNLKYVITNLQEDADKPNFKLPKEIYLEKMIEARHGYIKKE